MKNFFTIALIAFSLNAFAQSWSDGTVTNNLSEREITNLTVSPMAQPDNVCAGQPVNLLSAPEGGLTSLSYSWTSNPPGFMSDAANPVVSPDVTTVYTVKVTDGLSTITGNVTVTVKPTPKINLLPVNDSRITIISATEISACVFDSIKLDAENTGSIYQWNTGDNTQKIYVTTSGISVDMQYYSVTVTNPVTGCSDNAEMTINFTFTDCTYGIKEKPTVNLSVYPNPASDVFNILVANSSSELTVEVYSSMGLLVYRNIFKGVSSNSFKSTVDLTNQPTGVYFLNIKSGENNRSQKVILRR